MLPPFAGMLSLGLLPDSAGHRWIKVSPISAAAVHFASRYAETSTVGLLLYDRHLQLGWSDGMVVYSQ
jgi:hypothetical protein